MAFKTFRAIEILAERRVVLAAHVCLCVFTYLCLNDPLSACLWGAAWILYALSKVCFSVSCSSNSRNLCFFLTSGSTGGGKATAAAAAAGVTAGQQQQQRSEGRKAAAARSSSSRGKAPGVHSTAHIGAFWWRSQAIAICPSNCIRLNCLRLLAVRPACFSRHDPCCPTTPDLSYFLGRFYHLVVAGCLFVWLIVFTSSIHCNASSNDVVEMCSWFWHLPDHVNLFSLPVTSVLLSLPNLKGKIKMNKAHKYHPKRYLVF